MIFASKSTLSLNNLNMLSPKATKNLMNFVNFHPVREPFEVRQNTSICSLKFSWGQDMSYSPKYKYLLRKIDQRTCAI